jgi:hypothetical protein
MYDELADVVRIYSNLVEKIQIMTDDQKFIEQRVDNTVSKTKNAIKDVAQTYKAPRIKFKKSVK